ncbi:hypothetical protein BDD12DRAFT_343420 [Trichophaea hybrida]|nr:hypothetical protein BDD12DRAFT_343420 [Trichophaea hybrida]
MVFQLDISICELLFCLALAAGSSWYKSANTFRERDTLRRSRLISISCSGLGENTGYVNSFGVVGKLCWNFEASDIMCTGLRDVLAWRLYGLFITFMRLCICHWILIFCEPIN